MRVKAATVQRFALGAALVAALAWNLAHASEVQGIRVDTGATGTRAEIALDKPADYTVLHLKAPERLAVDLPASSLARSLKLPAGAGVVQSVRTGQPTAGTVRVVFDLGQPVAALKPRVEQGADGARLVLEWPGDGEAGSRPVVVPRAPQTPAAAATASDATSRLASQVAGALAAGASPATDERKADTPTVIPSTGPATGAVATTGDAASSGTAAAVPATPAVTGASEPARQAASTAANPAGKAATGSAPAHAGSGSAARPAAMPRNLRPLVIAIDAGHGGQDPGASGLNGSREKDLTLAIARELARQIDATPGLKAYLTRDTDVFLPLTRRTQLARQARADMFISIHADAAENRAARGSSVFVLSLKGASSQRARWLADKENASDLVGGVRLAQTSSTLAAVLLDLTQSGHMRASEDAAGQVLSGLGRIGNLHKNGIERANFAVLRTSDMPAMLVETAFISNPEEEQRLKDPEHQRALARAVLDGISTYFTRQPPPGTLFAARAEASVVASAGGM